MEKIPGLILVSLISFIVSSGCSHSRNLQSTQSVDPAKASIKNVQIVTPEKQSSSGTPNGSARLPAENRGEVYWSFKEIRNLQKLDDFVGKMNRKIKDAVRVATVSKEGEPVITDLLFDGESLHVTRNGVENVYDQIFVSRRYNEHYKGEFIEYWVSGKEMDSKKQLILQIHPDLFIL